MKQVELGKKNFLRAKHYIAISKLSALEFDSAFLEEFIKRELAFMIAKELESRLEVLRSTDIELDSEVFETSLFVFTLEELNKVFPSRTFTINEIDNGII